ncbi:c-type cytochrome [Duganella sp. FT80W]|uniref:C-type cytochrome n=1 Tax=Duganella guangzhouensis TaxID=2666084 RepID=A0A6I2KVU3_9BURK|nr:cytochrome c peroxidase [Duganella guangzhouensis]MRW89590.1 c-type cytochrome [Duganella guangzhouensis]
MNSSSRNRLTFIWPVAAALATVLLAACGQHAAPVATAPAPSPADVAQLGRQIFFDPSLSASGKMACATCHDPQHAYAPANGLAAQLGGAKLDQPGTRAVPSLRYALNRTPRWFKEFQANELERITETDSVPTGGLTRDGRFNTLHEQALAPLTAANEMANIGNTAIIAKLRQANYASEFRRVFGDKVFDQPELAFNKMLEALERFQLDDASFHPYTSKFDQYLQGKAQLSAAEQRGLLLFADPNKGNCAACHIASPGADGSAPLFTDYTFANLGLPRNPNITANADPKFYDLGLCGPDRKDQANMTKYCGMFKTPTLRNVASRQVFMHNGVFTDLADAVRFYATRESDRKHWYGKGRPYNDMPAAMRDNVDVIDAPMNRKTGDKPALSEAEVQDIVQFLRTLTDADVKVSDSR